MKFQNSSIHGFKVMLCIKKRDERTDGRTDNPEAICPSNFFEVGGIMTNSADPDQLASPEATDLHLHCFLKQGMSCSAREGLNMAVVSISSNA